MKTHVYKINHELFSEEDFMKDCPNHEFIQTVLPACQRLIAIGDIHGDLDLAIKSFKLAKLIDQHYNWIADPPNTIVVQVGDQIDSCRAIPNVFECHLKPYSDDRVEDMSVIEFFNAMHEKAARVGGAVYSLLGNHELMNSDGRFDYVSYNNQHNFYYENNGQVYNGSEGRSAAFRPGGPVAKMLACTRKAVLVVGSTMFVHAGMLPVLAKRLDYLNLDEKTKLRYLNAIVRKWLLHKLTKNQFIQYIDKNPEIYTNILNDRKTFVNDPDLSPFWTRIYGKIPENAKLDSKDCDMYVKEAIEIYKVGQLIVGHTPQLFANADGINGTCYAANGKNKLFRVDGGFAKAFRVLNNHDMVQVLEIINDSDFNILTDKSDATRHDLTPISNLSEKSRERVASIYSEDRYRKSKSTNRKK